jgi:hypothetical protein
LWSSCALCLGPGVLAQNNNSAKQNSRDAATATTNTAADPASADASSEPANPATVAYEYEFNQPEFYISRVLIEHDASGRGRITFKRRTDAEGFTEPLQLSPAALARVSANWEALNFLSSQESYQAEKQFPHLGTMQLRMKQGAAARSAEFNWTNNKQVSALVDEYRRVGEQAIFIFDITVARENQPLEAPKIMNRLDILITRNGVSDAQQLVPLLQDLAADERIPLIARNHADRLLKKIDKAKKKD